MATHPSSRTAGSRGDTNRSQLLALNNSDRVASLVGPYEKHWKKPVRIDRHHHAVQYSISARTKSGPVTPYNASRKSCTSNTMTCRIMHFSGVIQIQETCSQQWLENASIVIMSHDCRIMLTRNAHQNKAATVKLLTTLKFGTANWFNQLSWIEAFWTLVSF